MRKKPIILLTLLLSNIVSGQNIEWHIIPIGLQESSIETITIIIASVAVSVAVVMMIFHGYRFITADSPEDRKQAKDGIIYVLVGLLLIMVAAAIVSFIYTIRPHY